MIGHSYRSIFVLIDESTNQEVGNFGAIPGALLNACPNLLILKRNIFFLQRGKTGENPQNDQIIEQNSNFLEGLVSIGLLFLRIRNINFPTGRSCKKVFLSFQLFPHFRSLKTLTNTIL
jgi:hypothetical protein